VIYRDYEEALDEVALARNPNARVLSVAEVFDNDREVT
jgi:hypothetical protein